MDKSTKTIQWGETAFSNNVLEQIDFYMQKERENFNPYLTLYITPRMYHKLKCKSKTTKPPEEKFFVILVRQCVLNYNTKIIFKKW